MNPTRIREAVKEHKARLLEVPRAWVVFNDSGIESLINDLLREIEMHRKTDRTALVQLAGQVAPAVMSEAFKYDVNQEFASTPDDKQRVMADVVALLSVRVARALLKEIDK